MGSLAALALAFGGSSLSALARAKSGSKNVNGASPAVVGSLSDVPSLANAMPELPMRDASSTMMAVVADAIDDERKGVMVQCDENATTGGAVRERFG